MSWKDLTYLFCILDGVGSDCASGTPDEYLFSGIAAARLPHTKKNMESSDGCLQREVD